MAREEAQVALAGIRLHVRATHGPRGRGRVFGALGIALGGGGKGALSHGIRLLIIEAVTCNGHGSVIIIALLMILFSRIMVKL